MQTESQVSIIESTMEYWPAEDLDRIEALSCLQWAYLFKGQLGEVRRVDRRLEPLANRMGHVGCLWMGNRARWIADLVRHAVIDSSHSFAMQEKETWLRSENKWQSHAFSWLGQIDFWVPDSRAPARTPNAILPCSIHFQNVPSILCFGSHSAIIGLI